VWDAVIGGLVTGIIALTGVWLTLRHQARLATLAEDARVRERRVERLRESYRFLLRSAYGLMAHASMLPLALALAEQGKPDYFNDLVTQKQPDSNEQNANLMLEGEADREVLSVYGALSAQHTTFLAALTSYSNKGEHMPTGEYEERVASMREHAVRLGDLARERLSELERPVDSVALRKRGTR
jgi:hypothetical protein